MIKSIFTFLCMILLGTSYSNAQSNTLLASNNLDIINDNNTALVVLDESDANTPKYYDIPEEAVTFEMNPSNNQINIAVNNDIKYTKAELLSKESNTTVQTLKLKEDNKTVDVSSVDSGTYYLILSNEEGNVFSEKIIIL